MPQAEEIDGADACVAVREPEPEGATIIIASLIGGPFDGRRLSAASPNDEEELRLIYHEDLWGVYAWSQMAWHYREQVTLLIAKKHSLETSDLAAWASRQSGALELEAIPVMRLP